jgi:hypothetical protein
MGLSLLLSDLRWEQFHNRTYVAYALARNRATVVMEGSKWRVMLWDMQNVLLSQ